MAKLLVHATSGPEDPTRAALAFLVAKTAKEEGHDVKVFLAGNAVHLIKDEVISSVSGVGTGNLREHFDYLQREKVPLYLSGLSSKARGITETDLANKNAQFALPKVLVQLTMDSDKVLVY